MASRSQDDGPAESECREILRVLELGARAAGARGTEVDDVAQAVAERVVSKWSESHIEQARRRGTRFWHNYLRRSAKHAYLDSIRRDERRAAREMRATSDSSAVRRGTRTGRQPSRQTDPSDTDRYLARLLLVDLIDEHVDNPSQRAALVLEYVDGLTATEVAEKLGLSRRSVDGHRRKGKEALRAKLTQPDE